MTSGSDGGVSSFTLEGTFFDGQSSAAHAARALVQVGTRRLVVHFGEHKKEFALAQVRVDPRVGSAPRAIYLPQDMRLDTPDNDAADRLEHAISGKDRPVRAHLFESNWRWAVASIALVSVVVLAAVRLGVPWLAAHVAEQLPAEYVYRLGQGTLDALDHMAFEPSELAPERQRHIEELVEVMHQDEPALPLHVVFRKAGMPNAFALPDATIVVTDEFADLAKSDDELIAVLSHEMGHVRHRHTLRLALENSAVGLVAFAYLGDASQLAGLVATVPTILAHAHYSQTHETEADTYALEYLDRKHLPRAAFADILERLDHEVRGAGGERPAMLRYFESHPGTPERVARFRQTSVVPPK